MGPKIASSGNLAPRASWELPRLDFQAFWGSFWGLLNRTKNGTKNELILGPGAWGAQGGNAAPGGGNGLVWGPGGRLQRGVLRLRISDFRTPVP